MCYGENGMVKFLETLADHVFRHKYSMIQIFFKLNYEQITKVFTLSAGLLLIKHAWYLVLALSK
jgi:hypothetical protein